VLVATNLRRLMARDGLTFEEVVRATGLDERTVRGVVRGKNHAHARTLHKLAAGLGVSVDELFRPVGQSAARRFDRATNTLVESVVAAHPAKFCNWSEADFDELYSRFGTGGQLTDAGVLAAADAANAKRELLRQIGVILETGDAKLLTEFVELLYRRVTVGQPCQVAPTTR
jgi:transcriptional regulator with XRE-family HTH domain